MKYYNKRKRVRVSWTEVRIPDNHIHTWESLKLWCQLYDSNKRFYGGPYTRIWHFEDSHDALVFKITMGYK